MRAGCQVRGPLAIAVAGVAGSGKSTLGKTLAELLGAPLLDLDTLTNPLLDELGEDVFGGHWLASAHAAAVRRGRYAALLATASDVLVTAGSVVLVAPFTQELAGGTEWQHLCAAVVPATVRMVQVVGSPELFAARRAARGELRDRHRVLGPDPSPVGVPVVTVDARLTTAQQLDRLVRELGMQERAEPAPPLVQGDGPRFAGGR